MFFCSTGFNNAFLYWGGGGLVCQHCSKLAQEDFSLWAAQMHKKVHACWYFSSSSLNLFSSPLHTHLRFCAFKRIHIWRCCSIIWGKLHWTPQNPDCFDFLSEFSSFCWKCSKIIRCKSVSCEIWEPWDFGNVPKCCGCKDCEMSGPLTFETCSQISRLEGQWNLRTTGNFEKVPNLNGGIVFLNAFPNFAFQKKTPSLHSDFFGPCNCQLQCMAIRPLNSGGIPIRVRCGYPFRLFTPRQISTRFWKRCHCIGFPALINASNTVQQANTEYPGVKTPIPYHRPGRFCSEPDPSYWRRG